MSLLSRLFAKRNSTGGTRPPEVVLIPSPSAGTFTINIDASKHIVQAVTVFRNNTAQVVRTFHDLTLKSGENTVVIDNLPNAMQPESLRIPNSGDYAILDVLCSHERNDEHERKVESSVAELEQSKKRREEVMRMLRDYGNTLATSSTSQKNILKFTNKYLSVAEECDAEVRGIEEKLKVEKALLEDWRYSRTPFRGVAQITLFTTRNTSAALTITYMVTNASWSPLYDLRATSQKGKPSQNVYLHYRANLSQSTGEDWNDAQLTLSTRAPEDLDGGIPKPSTVQIQGVGPRSTNRTYRDLSPRRYHVPRLRERARSPVCVYRHHRLYSRSSSRSRSRSRARRDRSRSRSGDRDGSRSRSRDRSESRARLLGRGRSLSRDRSPTLRYSPDHRGPRPTTALSQSPRLRRRRNLTPSEPPHYPYHPNETVLITNDVTSVSYIMDGRCTILGDGKLHKVTIAILPFTATIHHVITPRISFDAYLQCSILNDSNYTLIPGVLSTFLDDKYVSKTTIPEVGTKDTFRCTLGIDTAIKVTHCIASTTSVSPETQLVERFKTVTHTSTTTIRNRRNDGEAIDVVERTSLPVVRTKRGGLVDSECVEARIKVLLKEPLGLAESETGDPIELDRPDGFCVQWGTGDGIMGPLSGNIVDKDKGKFMWVGKLGPGQEVSLESVWDVRAPVDVSWCESTVP